MDVPPKESRIWRIFPARYVFSLLGSIGFAIVYGLKVNLSVAMVGMLNHTALKQAGEADSALRKMENLTLPLEENCFTASELSDNRELDGPFVWSSDVQGIVLSCYFWGYFISQLPGGRIAELYSAKWVMFFSVFINVVCTILTPMMCKVHYSAAVVMRVGEGIGGGVSIPAMHTMLSKWAPPRERSFMLALTYAGTSLGTVISMLMAGLLTATGMTFPAMHTLLSKWAPPAERSFMSSVTYAGTSLGTVISILMAGMLTATVGWESVFYVMGGLSLLWCGLWVVLVQDTPQQQKYMTNEERIMITTALQNTGDQTKKPKLPVPWRSVFTSAPFLAILVAHVCSNIGWYMLLIELPFYMKQILKFNMKENALAVSLPFLSLWFFSMGLSSTLDWLRAKSVITTTCARKIATLIASVIPGCCLLALCFIGCNRAAAVALMALAITSTGGIFSGFLTNHIDIAPHFAGTLVALTNTVATIPGILVPIFVGYVTDGNQTISAWRQIFLLSVASYVVEMITFTCFGSGEEQPWNNPDATRNRMIDAESEGRSEGLLKEKATSGS